MTYEKADVYTRITNRIITDLEQGVRPWMQPWNSEKAGARILRPLRHNGVPYRGINIVMLWAESIERGYKYPTWMSYRQAQELKGQVRGGEKGALVVYADRIIKTEANEEGYDEERAIPFLKGYTVFNVAQIQGLPEQYYRKPESPAEPIAQRIEAAERFFANTGAHIRHGGDRAYYAQGSDHIQMPPFEAFRDAESYSATLAHEATHWTKHPARLNREFGRKRFGDEFYAQEELVAEMGAAFLCADLGITPEVREDHASYIASWLKVLKDDKRAVFTAASHAQKATDFLHRFQPALQVAS
ncbi:MAG TPA: zincin-like metallopeptidase domain-containing protein [Bryobacteraceae bacterium]|nr:zincin-like metallopeptidase domain-containing protein [Bryobacteraceae bacterium]